MTLVQAWIEGDTSTLVVDTLANGAGTYSGQRFEVAKVQTFPLAGTAIAYRGTDHAYLQVMANLWITHPNSYDEIIERVEQCVFNAAKVWPAGMPRHDAELIITGYSDAENRLAGQVFAIDLSGGGSARKIAEIDRCIVAPPTSPIPSLTTDEARLAVARQQIEVMKETGEVTGGRLLITEVTREGITTRIVQERI